MRILLTATASYAPPQGGATRSNLVWLDHLATAGHECRVVCGRSRQGAALAHHLSIQVIPVDEPAQRVQRLRSEIHEFRPDWVLVSSEDLGHGLLTEAHHSAPGSVVYLAHTPQFFPFGSASWNPQPAAARLVAESAGIVAISHTMAEYIHGALGHRPAVIHPPIYGSAPFPNHANFERGFLTMINPCAVKGISLFLKIAGALPQYEFGVVPGWGTTARDREALSALPNVRFLPNTPDIDQILEQTRVLLMPSLWMEGFGLIVMEAMLRGIPVVASDAGALRESKCGTGYVVPVAPIERYLPAYDELAMPRPEVPENAAAPWTQAIRELLCDRAAYDRESAASRDVSRRFVASLDAADLERFLLGLKRNREPRVPRSTIESLSPERRALLLDRLRKRKADA